MIPQALGFFGWKRPQVAAKTLRGLARCHGIERWPLIAFLDAGSDPATTKAIDFSPIPGGGNVLYLDGHVSAVIGADVANSIFAPLKNTKVLQSVD